MVRTAPRWKSSRPNMTPVADFQGLKEGDQIEVRWTEDCTLLPALVSATVAFGALVVVDTTDDPGWSCDPFEMFVTQRCPDGAWSR